MRASGITVGLGLGVRLLVGATSAPGDEAAQVRASWTAIDGASGRRVLAAEAARERGVDPEARSAEVEAALGIGRSRPLVLKRSCGLSY